MHAKLYLLFALASAMLYAVAASSLRAAAERGARTLHTALLANIVTALGFLAFLPWREGNVFPEAWWPSIVVGLLFFAGQWLAVLSLAKGHASIATPALGSKVVLVALILAFCFHRQLSINVWIAAVLTSLGFAVLAFSRHGGVKGIGLTLVLSVLAALSFAFFDVLTQVWSPWLTFGRLIPWAVISGTIISVPPILIADRQWPRLTRGGGWFLAAGVGLMALQSLILIWSIAAFHDAAGANVVYGSRGIWSVLLVWLFGRYFSRQERLTSGAMVTQRLAGAVLIAAAVLLVFWPF